MSNKTIYIAFACLASVFFNIQTYGQAFGANATAVSVSDCNQNSFYNTSSNGAYEIAASENSFTNKNFGVHTQNSGTLLLSGAEVWTFKTPGAANVCGVRMYYRTYLATAIPGDFSSIKIPFLDDCDVPNGTYTSGGICIEGDQKWKTGGGAPPFSPIDLTAKVKGDYVLEVYFELSGSSTSPNSCPEKMLVNNSGNNYKALYSIQSPVLNSNNPTSCNGTEGSITISGLLAGATYSISYMDDETFMEPADFTANASGQVIVSGLDAGIYSGFSLLVNGCTTELNTGVILTDPVITPSFTKIAAFCAGSTAPLLPAISNNFVSGTWSPAIIDNQVSGSYKFTPDADQCGIPVTVNVTVNPIVEPTFSFGTSLTICAGETVPTLPNTSSNGKIGTWSPSIIDNTNSGTYTFTPAAGQCAISTTFTVTVTPNIIPTFSFGTSLTVCAGDDMIPNLPKTSANGIKGTWDPAEVSNLVSGVYTFTPTAGVCATTAILTVTINTNEIPTFDFGTSLTLCSGTSAPVLPATSENNITGTWIPAVVSSTTSDTYTFLPDYGQCAENATFTVTVEDNISPTFEFGNSLTICENESVPVLPTTSEDGITGTWSPATIDNTQSGTYTFTPAAGQCATTATFSVTVNPDVTPIFSFGTTLTICEDESVPVLPATSENGITGSWSPATIDNTQSGTYTFTPAAGQCASTVTFPVTVNPNITPTFSFGTTLTICEDETVPVLPTTSENGITGTWSPAIIGNTQSGTYTFTPAAGECATTATFTVTVNPKTTPTFSFGTTLSVCAGDDMIPNLPKTSANGIKGTWNPSEVSNQVSGVYTFTPTAGLCATTAILTVTINTNIIPTFDFGTALTLCTGSSAPVLPATSENNITGTWIPAVVSNTTSDTYTFLPDYGQCAEYAIFTVTVEDNISPTFAFGTSLTICENGSVPALPTTSENGINGTWDAASVSTTTSAIYTFTPAAGQCATTATFTVTVNPDVTPTFSFGTALTICEDESAPALPATSENGITGTWSPATIDNTQSGTYTFTPAAGQCASAASFSVTVNPNITPTFSFGTALTICEDATAPALPATSSNGITGTWSPATVDNTNSGTYTFTPAAGQCAITATFTVTVNPNEMPAFDFGSSLTICAGESVPSLPATSTNGITGNWNPATVDNQNSGTYTFVPGGGCASSTTFTVTVTPNIIPGFDFGTELTICAGESVPSLTNTSQNGITGTWSPAIVSNSVSDTYTFTPTAGTCATTAVFKVTVNSNLIPAFDFGTSLTVCENATAPALPTTSANGITGTWSPATIDNVNNGVYIFTPASGLCATTATLTVTISPNETPTFSFGTSLTICAGESVPGLPTTSANSISGTWSPSTIDNTNSGTYTFTPAVGECATTATFTVTVNPKATPTFNFGTTLSVCAGDDMIPNLPKTSANGIKGTWNPSEVSNQVSGVYTFTPTAGLCATTAILTVTINTNVIPTFDFGTALTLCSGASAPVLPATSENNITGTWIPAVVSNTTSDTYTFLPDYGQCAENATFTVTVEDNITSTFAFGNSLTICENGSVPALPLTSENGINGTWDAASVSTTTSATYTFTPAAGQCASTATFTVTVNPVTTPTFDFGTTLVICAEGFVPALPNTSGNGITGTWNPAVVDKQSSGVYTFTPTAGLCATTTTLNVTVNQNVLPAFEFGTSFTICSDSTVPVLPAVSTNGITGTWNPSTIDNQADGTYTFKPDEGSCGTMTTLTVTVTQSIAPTFDLEPALTICTGGDVPVLPTTSINGIDGIWAPATIDKTVSGVYIFTPTATPEQCIGKFTLTVTVNPILEPSFTFGKTLSLCLGSTAPLLPAISDNGVTGTWLPAVISNQASATYTFTSAPGQCATEGTTLAVTVNDIPTVNAGVNNTVNDGNNVAGNNFTGTPAGVVYNWTNSNTGIGLPANGTGNIPSFTATNLGSAPISGTITVTPVNNGCPGAAQSYVITVNPLDKDVFVPNVFTPNNDGKNDFLFVYSNYIDELEMRIFNQYGQEIHLINSINRGWDGTHKGKQQPVGVYVYTLRAVLTDGRTVKLKGSITLLR